MKNQAEKGGRQRILEEAEALFTAQGYQAVSIRDIAQACKLTNAALYYHFPNKAELFREVIAHHVTHMSQRMREAGQGIEDSRARLVAVLSVYAAHIATQHSSFFSLRREARALAEEGGHGEGMHYMQILLRPVEEVLAQAAQAGEIRQLSERFSPAALLVGMVHGFTRHQRHGQETGITGEDVEALVDVFWYGLARKSEELKE